MRRAILALVVLVGVLGLADNAIAGRQHKPPKVTIRASRECTYHGMASGTQPVTVRLYEGETTAGPEVAQQTVPVVKHKWSAGLMAPKSGPYTAVATEPSQHEDTPEGQSKPVTCR
jgi:hypothetical protein